jgi:hypothetical protein
MYIQIPRPGKQHVKQQALPRHEQPQIEVITRAKGKKNKDRPRPRRPGAHKGQGALKKNDGPRRAFD